MSESPRRASETKRPGRRTRALSAPAVVAALLPLAVWVLMRVPGEDWWGGAALVYAPKAQWIAVPALGLLVAAIAHRGMLVAVNLAAVAFALFVIAGFELNRPVPPPEDRPVVRVATWNVYGWTDERELVRDRIMSWDCDVVCLQESRRAVFRDLLPGYESANIGDLRTYARGRIVRTQAPPDPMTRLRRMLLAEIETDAGPLTVINLHIPRADRVGPTPRQVKPLIEYIETGVNSRARKFDQLIDLLPPRAPLVVTGDMNTPPASRYHALVSERLTDSFETVGSGFGYTFLWRRKLPMLRIDYVWTGGGVEPLRHRTAPAHPSDHRPIITELALPAE
ncbi:MAG: endonuclease/exonuclease/phosphatase family protein [Armatimonadota bacterium]